MRKISLIRKWFIFWLIYFLFEVYIDLAWLDSTHPEVSWLGRIWMAAQSEALLLLAKIPSAHAVFYFLNRFSKEHKHRFLFSLGILLSLLAGIALYIPTIAELIYPHIFERPLPLESLEIFNQAMNAFMDIIFVTGLGYAFQQYNREKKWREKEKTLTQEKLRTELKFLKAQINPHFLFNTLNNIYGLTRKKSEDAPEAVLKLSEVLRYVLYDANTTAIEIGKEVTLIDNYIEIEKLRYSNRLEIVFTKEIDDKDRKIAPLLLLHFVENAFKHGSSESRFGAFIRIALILQENKLFLRIANSKEMIATEKEESIGLKNIKRQLELIYPSHQLKIDIKETEFIVELLIDLPDE